MIKLKKMKVIVMMINHLSWEKALNWKYMIIQVENLIYQFAKKT